MFLLFSRWRRRLIRADEIISPLGSLNSIFPLNFGGHKIIIISNLKTPHLNLFVSSRKFHNNIINDYKGNK